MEMKNPQQRSEPILEVDIFVEFYYSFYYPSSKNKINSQKKVTKKLQKC